MADQMQAIKRRMRSVSNTERITNAMKLVSAAKLKQATAKFTFIQDNLKHVVEKLYLAISREYAPSVYSEKQEGKTLYIILTGSKGLCGGYNSTITKEASLIMKQKGKNLFLALGTKGQEFCIQENCEMFQFQQEEILKFLGEPIDEWNYVHIQEIAKEILNQYLYGDINKIVVIYTHYVNTLVQRMEKIQLFPLQNDVKGMRESVYYMEYESNEPEFFRFLAEEYLALNLYSLIAESALCEHSARRTAMKNASDNAKEMLTELSVYYNRARQSTITNEIIEIVAGAEALKKE